LGELTAALRFLHCSNVRILLFFMSLSTHELARLPVRGNTKVDLDASQE